MAKIKRTINDIVEPKNEQRGEMHSNLRVLIVNFSRNLSVQPIVNRCHAVSHIATLIRNF